MIPAMKYNIPVRVKNSYNPEHPGTGTCPSSQLPRGMTCLKKKHASSALQQMPCGMPTRAEDEAMRTQLTTTHHPHISLVSKKF